MSSSWPNSMAACAIAFAPELLSGEIFYAQTFNGQEETDRWEEMLSLKAIAQECFACA